MPGEFGGNWEAGAVTGMGLDGLAHGAREIPGVHT